MGTQTTSSLPALVEARASGVLLHPTSLPGAGPLGTLGPEADAFIDWLRRAGQSVWQMLPTTPPPRDGTPYSSLSAFAGNVWLLSHEQLAEDGWIDDPDAFEQTASQRADFGRAIERAKRLLDGAVETLRKRPREAPVDAFAAFRRREADWIDDYGLFRVLRRHYASHAWTDWPAELALRDPQALAAARLQLADPIERVVLGQFLFDQQWQRLKRRAAQAGVLLVGDIPIYVAHDSSDVWANRELFDLDEHGQPRHVAGVPPDYFSETGQRWGNPLYDWKRVAEDGYSWWIRRLQRCFEQFDVVRLDHFRAFEAFWQIPASEPTAIKGRWVTGPGQALFQAVDSTLGRLPLIAEDLGTITDEVRELRDALGFPGMAILQFAFGGDSTNPYLPENVRPNTVIYPGTHDNDTVLGWWNALPDTDRERVIRYLGAAPDDPAWSLIELAWKTPACLAVAAAQDLLSLPTDARLNRPGQIGGNWDWRLADIADLDRISERLARLTVESARDAN